MISLDFSAVLVDWRQLLAGAGVTLVLTAISSTVGLALGCAAAWARSYGPRWLAAIVGVYVEFVRNTPFIVQLFFLFFGLPSLGVRLSPDMASALAMILNLGAYAMQIFLHVVLPPALSRVWPAMVSQIIIVMLGSAVCGQIATRELSYAANLIQSRNFRAFEAYIVVTLAYLALAVLLRRLLRWAGPRFLFGR